MDKYLDREKKYYSVANTTHQSQSRDTFDNSVDSSKRAIYNKQTTAFQDIRIIDTQQLMTPNS